MTYGSHLAHKRGRVKPRTYLGPIYTLDDQTRLRDVRANCDDCGKRLAEVHHDPTGVWAPGCLACLDCGRTYR